jgi:integrase
MPRIAKALSAIEVKRISQKGFHAVGTVSGLGILVSPQETKSWVLRVSYGGSRHPIGLGGYPSVTLSQAIEKARKIKSEIEAGIDPINAKKINKSKLIEDQAKSKTFEECAKQYLLRKTFNNVKHGKQWQTTLNQYVFPHIGNMLISEIGITHIKEVLDPIWYTKTETASRIQGRIKKIIDFAIVSGYRDKSNPAIWDGYLDSIYDSPKKIKVIEHFDAMPSDEVYDFLQALRKHKSISAKALEFLILTAVRSDSVRSATWSQIDLERKIWTVPKAHTKTKKREHTVPLVPESIALLNSLEKITGADLVFPSPNLKKLSDSTISKLMREMRINNEFKSIGVPHGFRATFSTWRLEKTNFSQELGELSLMHEVGDSVYQAYQRSDGLEKRREIMKDWAIFINKPPNKNLN